MNISTLFKVTIFVLSLSMVAGNHSISEFFQQKLKNLTDGNPKLKANITKSSKSILRSDLLIYSNKLDEQQKLGFQMTNRNKIKITLFLTFSAFATLSVSINVRVFYIVIITSKRKTRPANILVAHLSSVVIGFTIVLYVYLLETTNFISLTAPGICNVLAFLRNIIYTVFPLNTGAIIWMRTRSDAIIQRQSFVYRCIGVMWTITVLGNLPSIFMVEYVESSDNQLDKCKEIPLLGSFEATIVYESVRFLFSNVLVCLYFIQATVKLRSSLRYLRALKPLQNDKMAKQIRQVRFVYLHTFVFILNWFPNGLGLYLYKIFSRLGWTPDFVKSLTPLVYLNYSVFILCPLSYIFLLENMTMTQILVPCFQKNSETNILLNDDNNGLHVREKINPMIPHTSTTAPKEKRTTKANKTAIEESSVRVEVHEMSRMATIGVTETTARSSFLGTKLNCRQESFWEQEPSIPKSLAPIQYLANSAMVKYIVVQIHAEPAKQQENEKHNRKHSGET